MTDYETREALDVLELVASTHQEQHLLWRVVTSHRAGGLTLTEALAEALTIVADYGSPIDVLMREAEQEVERPSRR